MAGEIVFDPVAFRASFPAFESATKYPDDSLSGYFSMATCFIYPRGWALLHGDCLRNALYLMTAHIITLNGQTAKGRAQAGPVTSATVGGVTVSVAAPPATNGWKHWLSMTPYGLQVWALLSAKSAGGFYIGGSNERAGFRKAGGHF